jgi:molybdopterin synthase sulfur carrier subunit
MQVLIPSPLRSYTGGRDSVDASGSSLADLLRDLDRQFPGITFRMVDEQGSIRQHIRIFVNKEQVASLSMPLTGNEMVHIVAALTGG